MEQWSKEKFMLINTVGNNKVVILEMKKDGERMFFFNDQEAVIKIDKVNNNKK